MGCVDVVGPRGGPGDREHHKQQDGGGEWRKDALSQECMDKLLLLLHDCGQRTPLDSLP